MIEGIRGRLALGYVGIFALILAILGAVVLASFAGRVAAQQDKLLEQKARGTLDYVQSRFLGPGRKGRGPENRPPGDRPAGEKPTDGRGREEGHSPPPIGPIRASTDSDIGVVAVSPEGGKARTLEASSSASSLGLPLEGAMEESLRKKGEDHETVKGPGGEKMRVVSVPVTGPGGEVVVVQTAQPRGEVWKSVRNLAFVLVPAGVGGILLASVGGLFLSRRAMKPVEDSFRRQRTFVADASHELKTPLALVKINAEVMRRNPTDPENREILEDQLSEIDRMNALLSDLLTLARLDAGRLTVDQKPFDLSVVAAEAAGRFLKRAAVEGFRLEVEVPDLLPARGDPERTGQILAALLDNAARYTPQGGTITVSGRLLDGLAEASVGDKGSGIPPEHMERIFDRFYRAEEARTRAGGGTGLGLSIARDLARVQGGDLSAENLPRDEKGSGGALFRLQLPTR